MTENWLPVVGYEGFYEVSDLGRVRSLSRLRRNGRRMVGRMLKPTPDRHGYPYVLLHVDRIPKRRAVHRLVLQAFVGEAPEGMQACHNDGDSGNPKLTNLRWDTRSNNSRDSLRHGTHRGFENGVGRPFVPVPLAQRGVCVRGHVMTEENTYFAPSGRAHCRACHSRYKQAQFEHGENLGVAIE